MKETIILSNINSRELLRSLANSGVGSFNTRIFSAVSLAKEALLRSGLVIENTEIDSLKATCIIYDLLNDVDYFKGSVFADARNVLKAINYARTLCRGNEEEKMNEVFCDGEFKEKNNAILEVYRKYIEALENNNFIDSIGIINYALRHCDAMDSDFVVFKETPVEPLEEELLKKLSSNKYREVSIREFSGIEEKKLSDLTYTNAYGGVNEVEYIMGYIAENKIPYEDCTIALVDNTYINHFLTYKDSYNVPMSFGTGLSISASNAFKVLVLLDKWNSGYNGNDALNSLIYAPEFDLDKLWNCVSEEGLSDWDKKEIVKAAGNLRISTVDEHKLINYRKSLSHKDEIKRYELVEKFVKEFYKGYSYLVETYTKVEDEAFDNIAIKKTVSYLDTYFDGVNDGKLSDVLDDLSIVVINRSLSRPSSLYITDLNGALATVRKHLFICGLNARVFPGSPSENYLLLDSDLVRFNEENIKNSSRKVSLNKELLVNVIDNANSFGSKIHLSYAGYNLSDLKSENPSSMLFEIYKKEHGDNVTIDDMNKTIGRQHHYFEENISSLKNAGQLYLEGRNLSVDEKQADESSKVYLNKNISPSSAEYFFTCPKRFYLHYILDIKEPDEDDPFNTIPANDEGTLIHECMEDYGYHAEWTKDEFMLNAEKKFNNYLHKRIPIHDKNIRTIRRNYLEMAEEGYESDPHNEVYKSEYRIKGIVDPVTGLSFTGTIDRVEKINDEYLIVDYKTYKDVRNREDEIDSCFQIVLYSYLLELSEGKKVKGGEYRYLRNPRKITCVYNDGIKQQLLNMLKALKEALDAGDFECTDAEDNCKYCKYKRICGKADRGEE